MPKPRRRYRIASHHYIVADDIKTKREARRPLVDIVADRVEKCRRSRTCTTTRTGDTVVITLGGRAAAKHGQIWDSFRINEQP
mgnify:FL=1